jgi:hypothetical protein
MELLTRLLDLERRFWTGTADFYREHLAAEFLMLFPGLGFLDREAAIRGVADGQRWTRVDISDTRLMHLAPGSVLLAYSARAEREGQPAYHGLVGSGYVEERGSWRLAFHQQSPL